jgi:hypothetical protein
MQPLPPSTLGGRGRAVWGVVQRTKKQRRSVSGSWFANARWWELSGIGPDHVLLEFVEAGSIEC